MVADTYVNRVPVLTGGAGKEQSGEFYANHFIPNSSNQLMMRAKIAAKATK